MSRPTWDETWLDIAEVVGRRSRCVRAQVGCVLVATDNQVVSCTYNGPPPNLNVPDESDCREWCPRARSESLEPGYTDCVASHAEMNAVSRADFSRLQGGTAFVTGSTCYTCAKLLAAAGVAKVIMMVLETDAHRSPQKTISFFEDSGIEVEVVHR